MILIPVKKLSNAKQRLATVLDQPTRTRLARAMLTDVAETIVSWAGHPPVALVTSDPFATALARKLGFEIIPDYANESETGASDRKERENGSGANEGEKNSTK